MGVPDEAGRAPSGSAAGQGRRHRAEDDSRESGSLMRASVIQRVDLTRKGKQVPTKEGQEVSQLGFPVSSRFVPHSTESRDFRTLPPHLPATFSTLRDAPSVVQSVDAALPTLGATRVSAALSQGEER
jgi:hypothetical protein